MLTLSKNTVFINDEKQYSGVIKVSEMVRKDLSAVFEKDLSMVSYKFDNTDKCNATGSCIAQGTCVENDTAIIYGTLGRGGIIDSLVAAGKVDISAVSGKWEVYSLSIIEEPIPGVKKALVVVGSDKRGTIYGLFRISELCGVSPLVNWSGVAPEPKSEVIVTEKMLGFSKEPSVKYRGIFINDEWPAFGTWATTRFGGVNAECYAEVFEMILRLKGNYMWPAMWATNISLEGPGTKSVELADELGIVMSTSHHEPCMRTGEEYSMMRGPESPYGDAWDFLSNREGITKFWEDGLKRNGKFENVITMGMRGERDTAIMAEATLAENIALLKDVIRTQNELIRQNVNPDLTKVPRQIVLFTEVEKFYYGDENTPGLIEDPELDGITIMFSDNNYGYTRTLPTKKMLNHPGGYGLYYHVDMHGGAYSYEWIGSTYLPRIHDQLTTAYDYGIDQIWVVNVGDIVSQELEISFILDMAYDMEKYGHNNLNCTEMYTKEWIERQFGNSFNEADKEKIFDVITTYTKILERRKHEIMNEKVYHPVHFGETYELMAMSDRVLKECRELLTVCPEGMKTGFYELVYYPAFGTCNLMKAWAASTLNRFFIEENRNTANDYNEIIDQCIKDDEEVINGLHTVGNGKFYGQGLSEHFNFRFWNDNNNQLPLKVYCYPANNKRLLLSKKDESWFLTGREYTQREMTIYDFLRPDVDSIILELSCASKEAVAYEIENGCEWLKFSKISGVTEKTDEVVVSIDRSKIKDNTRATVRVKGGPEIFSDLHFVANSKEYVDNMLRTSLKEYYDETTGNGNNVEPDEHVAKDRVFIGFTGYTAIEAENFSNRHDTDEAEYKLLKPYGITGSAMKLLPNTVDATLLEDKPYLEYLVYSEEEGEFDAQFVFAPSTPVTDVPDQSFGVSTNAGDIKRVNTVNDTSKPYFNSLQWVLESKAGCKRINCRIWLKHGINNIRYYQLSPNLILERMVIARDIKGIPVSYLGPKESYYYER